VSPFERILAQPTVVDILERAVRMDRVASAYLFEGPSGVGKLKCAIALAQTVIGGDAAVARRIAEGTHPDVRVFLPREEGKRNIQVEQLRSEILPFAQFAPFEAPAAFVIFPEADVSFPEHPPEAANALLKTLEEPPDGLVLILVAQSYVRLPATVASRCARLRLRPLPAAQVAAALRRQRPTITAERAALLAELARGSIGRALELDRLDWPAEYARLLAALGQGGGQVLTVAESLLRLAGKGGIREAARLLGDVLRRAAHVAAGRPPACALLADEAALLARLPGAASLDRCVALWDKLARSAAEADQLNLDPLQTLVGIVHGLAAEPARAGGGRRPQARPEPR
jgi:DNA polymerase-3 subunit delta'